MIVDLPNNVRVVICDACEQRNARRPGEPWLSWHARLFGWELRGDAADGCDLCPSCAGLPADEWPEWAGEIASALSPAPTGGGVPS